MYSEHIEDFLNFLKVAQMDYNIAMAEEKEADEETQDVLHKIELGKNNYHEYAKLSKLLCNIRKKRRSAKDKVQVLQSIVDWAENNPKTVKELERLLGVVRKVEKGLENRYYTPKTRVLDEIEEGGKQDEK